ncbi:MAG: hypothetical protein HQ534_10805 [Armatimonadetes bacterium]|nr:hypothetical protein [Armatimonadota bacterium]
MNKKSLFISIGVCFVISIIAYFINFLPYHFYSLFNKFGLLLDYDIKPLLYSIWQVQALISTLTIMILTIMQTLFEKRIYGLRFLEILEMKYFFSIRIMISIIMVFILYFFVAKEMLASIIFIFSLNTYLIIYLILTSFRLAMFPEDLDDYIRDVIKKIILEEIKSENGEYYESK